MNHRTPTATGIRQYEIVPALIRKRVHPDAPPLGMNRKLTTARAPQTAIRLLKTSIEIRAQRHARNKPAPVAKPHAAIQRARGAKMSCAKLPISPSGPRFGKLMQMDSMVQILTAITNTPTFFSFLAQSGLIFGCRLRSILLVTPYSRSATIDVIFSESGK